MKWVLIIWWVNGFGHQIDIEAIAEFETKDQCLVAFQEIQGKAMHGKCINGRAIRK